MHSEIRQTWLILILWNSINFRGRDLFFSIAFPTFLSSYDVRPDLTLRESFFLEVSSACSADPSVPLLEEEWACRTSSLATDSATVSSHDLSKEDVLLNSGAEPDTVFVFVIGNFVVISESLFEGPQDVDASGWVDAFFTRFDPAAVEIFQTSWK